MGWTEERVELLKKFWRDGLDVSQIAKQLGGVTRNAVIGKVHRLGLSGRAMPSKTQRIVFKKPAPPRKLPEQRILPPRESVAKKSRLRVPRRSMWKRLSGRQRCARWRVICVSGRLVILNSPTSLSAGKNVADHTANHTRQLPINLHRARKKRA